MAKLIIIVGSGPGVGTATAVKFASQGFRVALLARNEDRLKEALDKLPKTESGKEHQTYRVDTADHEALKATLDQVKSDMGAPEVVHFNAARVAPSEFGNTPLSRLSEDFAVMNIGLYVTAAWAVPVLESTKQQNPESHPSFLITGGGIWELPAHEFFALSMQKAAQVNFANSLSQVAGPKGIHVATISVNGMIADDNPVINAKAIANRFWDLYSQQESDWQSMVEVGTLDDLKALFAYMRQSGQ